MLFIIQFWGSSFEARRLHFFSDMSLSILLLGSYQSNPQYQVSLFRRYFPYDILSVNSLCVLLLKTKSKTYAKMILEKYVYSVTHSPGEP